jgi:septal ring factor EnvC (AmiA/AmiB activator)
MDAETITAISNALTGPASGLFVMGVILYGIYKVAVNLLSPFLTSVAEHIKDGFEKQSTSLATLVEEVKQDREHHRGMSTRIDKIETDITEIKADVSDIKNSVKT